MFQNLKKSLIGAVALSVLGCAASADNWRGWNIHVDGYPNTVAMDKFAELLAAEALITLYVFGNATAYLLSAHQTEVTVEVGEVEEVLTDNGQTALHGALWELDQDIAAHAPDDTHMVATVTAYAAALMRRAGVDPEAQVRMFEKLEHMSQPPGGFVWLMSHPPLGARIEAVRDLHGQWDGSVEGA